jgi:hypothetical protein
MTTEAQLKSEIRTITPEEALKILERNQNNRRVRQSRVETYARDMKAGRWKVNGVPLVFNSSGKLHDGQHRLLACVQAGKPFTTLVVWGVSDSAHSTIDTGMARTMADELRWQGETSAAELGAVLNLCWQYDTGVIMDPFRTPSRNDLLSYLRRHPNIRKSIDHHRPVRPLAIRGTAFAATHYLIAREHGDETADLFSLSVIEGTNYSEGDPCLMLRKYATTVAAKRTERPNTTEWFAVCIKAANAWLLGRPVHNLRWRRVGPNREKFPSIVTKEEAGDVLSSEDEK